MFPGTFVGTRPFFNDAVAGTKVVVKAGVGDLYFLKLVNTTAAAAYLQLFDQVTANVTVGTTGPDWAIRLTANESVVIPVTAWQFVNGLIIAGTTTPTGATGAAISVSALYA